MDKVDVLKKEIDKIKERNSRVEKDKAWETSWVRRVFIAISTYLLVVILLLYIGTEKPFVTAVVPAIAYLLSTASLEVVKSWWLKNKGV